MSFLNWLTLFSYIALNVDVLLETRKIYRTKSSADLSLFGMAIRFFALVILLIKFDSLGDVSLIIGQGLVALTFAFYFVLALSYFRHKKSRRNK